MFKCAAILRMCSCSRHMCHIGVLVLVMSVRARLACEPPARIRSQGEGHNFVRADEVEEGWRIFDPLLKQLEKQDNARADGGAASLTRFRIDALACKGLLGRSIKQLHVARDRIANKCFQA